MGAEIAIATLVAAQMYNAQKQQHAAQRQRSMAEAQQLKAMQEQEAQKKEALAERKELIDQQREGLVQGYRTSTRNEAPKPSGLVGKLGDDTLG